MTNSTFKLFNRLSSKQNWKKKKNTKTQYTILEFIGLVNEHSNFEIQILKMF